MDPLAYKQFLKLEKSHWWFIGRRRILFALLERHLPAGEGDRLIMDIGCGYGGMLEGLSRRGHAMGMEVDLDSARFSRERGFGGVCLGSGYDMPLRPDSLDLITLFDTIEHIEDDGAVVRQVGRALKPGGHLMITVPAYQFLYADNDRIARHYRRYTLSRIRGLLDDAELTLVKGTHYNVLLFPLILPAVLLLKLKQRFRGPLDDERQGSTNLSYRYPFGLNRLLEGIFSFERHILSRISSPVGHSIAVLARKDGGRP